MVRLGCDQLTRNYLAKHQAANRRSQEFKHHLPRLFGWLGIAAQLDPDVPGD